MNSVAGKMDRSFRKFPIIYYRSSFLDCSPLSFLYPAIFFKSRGSIVIFLFVNNEGVSL